MINQNALVKFDYDKLPSDYYEEYFEKFGNETFIFLGEIYQMPGHCIVANFETGQLLLGYHTENFRELTVDEC